MADRNDTFGRRDYVIISVVEVLRSGLSCVPDLTMSSMVRHDAPFFRKSLMKWSLFKQLMVSALFACSLSADVPDVREHAAGAAEDSGQTTRDGGRRTAESGGRMTEDGRRVKVGLVANQTRGCLFA